MQRGCSLLPRQQWDSFKTRERLAVFQSFLPFFLSFFLSFFLPFSLSSFSLRLLLLLLPSSLERNRSGHRDFARCTEQLVLYGLIGLSTSRETPARVISWTAAIWLSVHGLIWSATINRSPEAFCFSLFSFFHSVFDSACFRSYNRRPNRAVCWIVCFKILSMNR